MTNSRISFKCLKTEQLIIDNYKLFCRDHLTIATYFHSKDLSWNLLSWSVLHLQITRMINSIKTLFTLPRPWFTYFYPLNVNCQNNCWTETMWLLLCSFSLILLDIEIKLTTNTLTHESFMASTISSLQGHQLNEMCFISHLSYFGKKL